MRNFFTTIFVISTLVILGFSSNIFADESIESLGNAGQSSSSQRQIDEIIVTSRKIEENIQQVPVAVYAVDEKALDDFRPTTMRDMDSLAPNLQIGILLLEIRALFLFVVVVMLKLKKHKTRLLA